MKKLLLAFLLCPFMVLGQIGQDYNFGTNYAIIQSDLDTRSVFNLVPIAANLTVTFPAPTTAAATKTLKIQNKGAFKVKVMPFNVDLEPGIGTNYPMIIIDWKNPGWSITAAPSSSQPQSANTALLGPASGGSAIAGFRTLVEADIPLITYSKISNPPSLFSGAYNDLTGKPTLFSGSYIDLTNKPSLFSGAYADLSGKPTLFSGSYLDLTNKPTIPAAQVNADWAASSGVSQILNKPAVVTAEIDPVWTAAIPNYYTKTQGDARYLQSFTETDPQFDTKFSGKSTTNLSEGANLYYTASRFNTAFSTKSTTDLTEGSNLYYTAARFNTAFSGKSTTDLPEGTRLYYTQSRFDAAFTAKNTDALTEGSTNQYFTTARARASFTAGTGISIPSGVITNTAPDQVVTLTAGRGIAITGTYPNFTIAMVTPTISTTARALNTNFTPNATKETFAFYTVTCTVTNPLLVGTSTASVFLEYSTNAGSSWNPVTSQANSSGVGVTVTLQLTNGQTGVVSGVIPAGALARLRSTTSGTASVTIVSTFEMVY